MKCTLQRTLLGLVLVLSFAPQSFAQQSVIIRGQSGSTVGTYDVLRSNGSGALNVNVTSGVTTGLTDAQLRATPVPVSGTVTATTGGLTNTELRATPAPISGTVTATTGGLTNTELRATPVPVSGTVTASGPVTDAQLRATPVPISGTVTATTGGLTDTQLRASAVPISGTVTATTVVGVTFTTTTPTVTSSSATLLASNASRKNVLIQNNDATGIVYLNFTTTATTSHLRINPSQSLFLTGIIPTAAIQAIGSIASNANIVVIEGQ